MLEFSSDASFFNFFSPGESSGRIVRKSSGTARTRTYGCQPKDTVNMIN